jgi:hypothetical protein
MTPAQHKQYLIDSIVEMEAFNAKLTRKIETDQQYMSDTVLQSMCNIVDRKDENIRQFKQLLREQYGYEYTAQ